MGIEQIVGLLSRWIHIASAIAVLGGALFARAALVPAGQTALLARYAGVFRAGVIGLLLSGLYNLLRKTATPPPYHAVFGVKFLLALHVFAIAFLLGSGGGDNAKRARQLTGVVISGAVIVALSAYLRYLSQ